MIIIACSQCNLQHDVTNFAQGSRFKCRCGAEIQVPSQKIVAGSLSCPQCGASVSDKSSRCETCGAYLTTGVCPHCFNRLAEHARYCDHCGTEITPHDSHKKQSEDLLCPRCQDHLHQLMLNKTPVDECLSCGGLWINNQALKRLIEEQRQTQQHMIEMGEVSTFHANRGVEPVVYLKCPYCKKVMNRVNFGKSSGIIVDVCQQHGTWFDNEELMLILQWVADGGLTKQKQREAQQTIKKIKSSVSGGRIQQKVSLAESVGFALDMAADLTDLF